MLILDTNVVFDAQIAAICRAHPASIATHNVNDPLGTLNSVIFPRFYE